MGVLKAELAHRVQAACYLEGDFLLRSGQRASFYFDKYLFEADPELLTAVAEQMASLVPAGTQVLAGLELGGVPLATALSLRTGLPQALVRKQAKSYGTAKLAEGAEVSGRHVLVVEDVITTGGQVVASTQELRARGAVVSSVLCAIDRRIPESTVKDLAWAGDKLSEAGLAVLALFRLEDLVGRAESGT
ncbi:MAG TPA: orotate phosphoribosyltransferase [Acidimicrobiales bacterium]|nr:orotate phosphoribosyltransferase [Acidimicrobiales bacterium]